MGTETSVIRRYDEIDGIRGWAALAVVLQHLIANIFASRFPVLHEVVPHFLRDGNLAVCVFFVLSGDALSSQYLQTLDPATVRGLTVRRYFRLAGVVVFSSLVVYVLMQLGLTFNQQAKVVLGNTGVLENLLNFRPNLVGVLVYSLVTVYTEIDPALAYNPPLWTMSIELAGSMALFLYLFVYRELRYKFLTTLVIFIVVAFTSPYLSLFFVGLMIGMLRVRGAFEAARLSIFWQIVSTASFVALAIVDSLFELGVLLRIVTAICIVLSIYASRPMLFLMRSRLSRFLGRISFPLYAIQFAVFASFTSWAVVFANDRGMLTLWVAAAISGLSIVLIIGLGAAIAVIEKRYLRLVSRVLTTLTTPRAVS